MMKDIGEEAATEVQPQIDSVDRSHISREIVVDFSNTAAKLTEGLLEAYQTPLEQIKKELRELTQKQESLIDRMSVENKKLAETAENEALSEMFTKIKAYQGKLSSIKKEMTNIHERTFKLKKRALRLQQLKQKEALSRESQREQEIRREQELIGKPSII